MIVAELTEREVRIVFSDRKMKKIDKKWANVVAYVTLGLLGIAALLVFTSAPIMKEAGYGIKYYEVPALQEETILVLNDMPVPTINGVELKALENDVDTIAVKYMFVGVILAILLMLVMFILGIYQTIIASRFADVATAVYKESGKIMEP